MNSRERDFSASETALHEAGHAVLHVMLGIGCKSVTIVSDGEFAGVTRHRSEHGHHDDDVENLRIYAEDSFWLRHAISSYAGAEALRRSGIANYEVGAEQDMRDAAYAISKITGDAETVDALHVVAKRRCLALVENYWPEIERVAKALADSRTLTGEAVGKIVRRSICERAAPLVTW
jgi:hypothetical protein